MENKSQSGLSVSENDNSALLELFVDEIKDIYWAEKHLASELPKMSKLATSGQLKQAFEDHASQTEQHLVRLETIFEKLGRKAVAKKCEAMEGLLEEAKSIIEETQAGSMTRDAGLILSSQKVEHYEIATYGTLRIFANVLGMYEIALLLEETLNEEKSTDMHLTEIAEGFVNESAVHEEK
jgi:ferritin-like metal-binding protein YciE